MDNPRLHGSPPFPVAVIHGGPGALGEMAPVARRLAQRRGVLEPLQTATTLDGQVEELRDILQRCAARPVTLIGHSWGAWLSIILAARHPEGIGKLILVASGPFEERWVDSLRATRMGRLTAAERAEFDRVVEALQSAAKSESDTLLARLGELASKADNFDPLPESGDAADRVDLRGGAYQAVWASAAEMRRSGELLALAGRIQCPVTAIHGEWDPHPADSVEQPLAARLEDFRFVHLARCGHTPWIERHARDEFFRLLEQETG